MDDQKEQLEAGSAEAEFWFGYDQWSGEVDERETSDYIEEVC